MWCRVLRGKYNRETDMNIVTCKSTDSSLWKALNALTPAINLYSYWIVGDGKNIDAWSDAWIGEGIVLEQMVDIPQHLIGMKLYELVDIEGKWNWNMMKDRLPVTLTKQIAAVPPPNEEFGNDDRVLAGGNGMQFSVSAMYRKLSDFSNGNEDSKWRKIWSVNAPERVRSFLWLMLHGRLLTNALKSKMRLCHAMCNFCSDIEESILHVMRDCPKAREVWRYLLPTSQTFHFYNANFQEWVNFNLSNDMHWKGSGNWCDIWAISCHCLWNWRNKELYDAEFVRPVYPSQHILTLVDDYMGATSSNDIATMKSKVLSLIGWKPPKDLFVRVNTDGAYKEHVVAGCGGLIRGSHGEWLGGFAKCVGICSAFVAELWGVYEGLRYAYRLGFRMVELHIDSEAVVRVLTKRSSLSSVGSSLLKQIWHMLERDWVVEISHTYREANKCADVLANLGCSMVYDVVFFDLCPLHVRDMYHYDLTGNSSPRFIAL
jgi:ribonuclease HI